MCVRVCVCSCQGSKEDLSLLQERSHLGFGTIEESQTADHHDSTPKYYSSDSQRGPWQVGSRKERANSDPDIPTGN